MNKNQQSQALITHFLNLYQARHGSKPTINRYRVKWGMLDVIDSVGYEKAGLLMEYYFTCEPPHTIEQFFQSFDKLEEMLLESRKDEERRARLREETRKRMMELEQ